jgi:hypothetical protein
MVCSNTFNIDGRDLHLHAQVLGTELPVGMPCQALSIHSICRSAAGCCGPSGCFVVLPGFLGGASGALAVTVKGNPIALHACICTFAQLCRSAGFLVCWCQWHLADAGLPNWLPGRPWMHCNGCEGPNLCCRRKFVSVCVWCGKFPNTVNSCQATLPSIALGGRQFLGFCVLRGSRFLGMPRFSVISEELRFAFCVENSCPFKPCCTVDRHSFTYGCELWFTCQ